MNDSSEKKRITRRQIVVLAFLYSLMMCSLCTYRAIDRLVHPMAFWPTGNLWYEEGAQAIAFAVFAFACISFYLHNPRLNDRNRPFFPVLWRDRRELRVVLYTWAFLLLSDVPSSIFKAIYALHVGPVFFFPTFWSAFDAGSLVFGGLGIAIIVYDRRRLRRDRKDSNECLHCGYDLRATPDRCPECGTIYSHKSDCAQNAL
jgi:hypothetical protein